jgi:hypothetical protein
MKKMMMMMNSSQSRVKARTRTTTCFPVLRGTGATTAFLTALILLLLSYDDTVVLWTPVVEASKDSYSYYANGITNPNIKEKMYWREGYNVLEDLDQFAALYVTYHSCA